MLNNFSSHARWKQLTIASLGIISVGFSQSALSAPLGNQQDIINLSAGVKNADFTRVTSSQVESQLKSASNKLNSLEAAISKVENSKVVSSAEADQISKDTLEYAQNIKQALDVALKEASTLAESKGAKGSIGSLETFEKVEKANFPRLQQLDQKAKSVELKIKNGEFRLSNASLQQLSPADRQSFVNEINAPARQIYIQQRPDLFNRVSAPQKVSQDTDY
jgi:hypothetical protein